MSEYKDPHAGDVWAASDDQTFPDDFSLDEAEFASELRELFGPEREDLPPLYTQTLLDTVHIAAAEPGFEQKTAYRVLRRLSLGRAPLVAGAPRVPSWRPARGAPRTFALGFSLLMVFMVFTMVLASPIFGAGVRILLGQTGVEQVHGYPSNVRPSAVPGSAQSRMPRTTDMPIYWLDTITKNYRYLGTRLLDSTDWSRGPIVDMQYILTRPGKGSGVLDIREFQVNPKYAAVLQVVEDGSVTPVQVGDMPAAFVDGVWVPVPARDRDTVSGAMNPSTATSYTWESGVRSELIFERDGVVFWIVGDQRDGADQAALVSLAQDLVATSYAQLDTRWPERLRLVDEALIQSFQEPIGREVYHLVPAGASLDSGSGVFTLSQP